MDGSLDGNKHTGAQERNGLTGRRGQGEIRSDEDLAFHIENLAAAHPVFAPLVSEAGSVPIRWLDSGFKGLVWVVTGQQISVAAGRAIFGRLDAALGGITAEAIASASDGVLRGAGFSAPKIRTLRALQEAALSGGLDLAALEQKNAEDAVAALCAIKGIGPWTAEVYLLFAAGHPDIFPAADLALQEAARLAFALDARPPARELRVMSDVWSPWRSAAARLLWAYYRAKKGGKAVAPV
ncbi:MAG: DNA-3-methyladenine glycosylase 2 family protein [Rhodomicrobium sp.]|nr:DNA-3-methyladenine glycosylase 2 family protein [Rhodomicrobium sp.]